MHGIEGGPQVDIWVAIFIVILCVLLSAFFSASETALTAASHARMHTLEKEGDKRALLVTRLLRQRNRMIAALLLGSTLVNIGGSAFTTSVLVVLTGESGAVYATIIMTAAASGVRRGVAEDARDQSAGPHFARRGEKHQPVRRRLRTFARRR